MENQYNQQQNGYGQPSNGYNPHYQNGYNAGFQQGYNQQPPVIIRPKTNGLGTAGFVLSLLAFLFCWVPFVDVILWLLGAIFSIIGLFKAPRGLAIAGTVISFIGIIVLIVFFGALIGLAGLSAATAGM